MGLTKPLGRHLHLRSRGFQSDAWLEPPGYVQIMPLIRRVRVSLQREEDVSGRIGAERFPKYANHGIGLAVEHQHAADRIRVAAESADPKTMTHHGERWSSGPILGCGKNTTHRRRGIEDRKEIR